jgi:hypothetical protein
VLENFAIMKPESGEAVAAIEHLMGPGEEFSIFDLPQIKVPAGGALNWEMPDGHAEQAFNCVILHRKPVRAFWGTAMSEGGSPPDCTSSGNLIGTANESAREAYGVGGECATCPMNQWGSAKGQDGKPTRGKGCKQVTRLFAAIESTVLPVVLRIPPSSYRVTQNALLLQAGMGKAYDSFITSVSLEKTRNADGIEYAVVKLTPGADLGAEELAIVRKRRDDFMPLFEAVRFDADDGAA